MEAKVSIHGEVAVIHLSGQVDFDSHEAFKIATRGKMEDVRVVFDLSRLDFVGSNAITPFVQTLSEINSSARAVGMYGVRSEFKKIFKASELGHLEIFEDQNTAIGSVLPGQEG